MEFKNKKLEQFEKDIEKKEIAVIGIGVSNIPLIDYLWSRVPVLPAQGYDPQEPVDRLLAPDPHGCRVSGDLYPHYPQPQAVGAQRSLGSL